MGPTSWGLTTVPTLWQAETMRSPSSNSHFFLPSWLHAVWNQGGDENMSKQNLKTRLSLPEDGITAGAVWFNQPYTSDAVQHARSGFDLFAETETQIKKAISFTTFQCCHSLLNRKSSVMTDFVCCVWHVLRESRGGVRCALSDDRCGTNSEMHLSVCNYAFLGAWNGCSWPATVRPWGRRDSLRLVYPVFGVL